MRILVLSDTHGDTGSIELALSGAGAALALHLGDCAGDMAFVMRSYPDLPFYSVCGNCDFGSAAPAELTLEIEGKRLYLLHGHTKNVKNGDGSLLAADTLTAGGEVPRRFGIESFPAPRPSAQGG